jgi:pimeloyl-ACP methyl ester carboxylesterase
MRAFHGSLFQYTTPFPSLQAFESYGGSFLPASEHNLPEKKCILLGGLSDGLIPVPYAEALEQACAERGWSLVQPLISSSFLGFGHGSLERDTNELESLIDCLRKERHAKHVAIVGHSTGCQNAIHFMRHAKNQELRDMVKMIALQAPVSDREQAATQDGYDEIIKIARQLKDEGKEEEMMPRSAFWAPITVSRFLSLQDKGGPDDMFSSDYTDDELYKRLGHIGWSKDIHALVQFSGSDEYVAKHIDSEILLDRLVKAMNQDCKEGERQVASGLYVVSGNHNLSAGPGDSDMFVNAVLAHLEAAVPTV